MEVTIKYTTSELERINDKAVLDFLQVHANDDSITNTTETVNKETVYEWTLNLPHTEENISVLKKLSNFVLSVVYR